jgi:hypothetical protein
MTRTPYSSGRLPFDSKVSSSIAARRRNLRSQASRLTLRSTVAAAAFVGLGVFAPGEAWAQCVVGGTTVTCADTSTTDTTFPANPPVDRNYQGVLAVPIDVTVDSGATISGNGLAFTNNGTGGITVNNGGTISVDAGNTPTAGGTAALSLTALGGPIVYTGGDIINNGNGNALDARQTGGIGSVSITAGAIFSAAGEGVTVRDVAGSTGISVTTGAVTALTAGKDGIDAQSQSLTGNITEVANGDINAGNAGMVAAILNAGATGSIDVTANGAMTARFGVDAENFGSGNTFVTTVGPVNVTNGNGIFALATGGHVIVNAGDVTSISNTAIIAQQTKVAGAGLVGVTAGNVSGTTGIDVHNFGTGDIGVVANGTVTGTVAEGIKAIGNAGIFVSVSNTVTGATRGLSLIGGTGGTGAIFVTGSGGFVGGSDDAVNIKNNGAGGVTVNISGASSSTGGEGFVIRDTAIGGDISVTTGAVTALTAGKDGIDVQTQSTTASITEVANGDINAGNAGMVAAILNAGGTGNIDVTANGSMTARFGVDAENFGSGSTSVTTVGPVNVTTGNGIFALATGGNVTVNAGDVTSTGNTAIIAQQTKVAGAGVVDVTAGNVSGTTGIDAHNFGTGAVLVTANGTVTGTIAEGIKAVGNGAVTVDVADTVTGATRGLSLIGGTGGAGNISVTGTGGFVGGTDDAANIKNNGSGTVTVDISGASSSAGGEGFVIRDTAAGGNISVTTGAVTALTAGKDGIDVQTQSTTAGITEVANGDINAGNAGMVAAILNAGGTGNIDVTANGSMTARFGVDAENFGSGSTSVTTVGPVNVTNGNGIFALATGGNVVVNAGDVTSISNTAIIAQQTKVAGTGAVIVGTTGNVSGTTGIDAHDFGTGLVGVVTGGTVTGTIAEGIKAVGNAGVIVTAFDTVTGATRGLSLIGGTGGAGDILVNGPGGFVGGSDDAVNIKNNGSGSVTVAISGASSSTGGEGIVVRDTAAGGDISVTTGAVTALTAGKDGIDVQAQSLTGNVTIVANGDVNAGNAGIVGAIFPAAGTGNVDVTANGAIDARFGVDAENFGTGNTTVTTVGPVNATTGNGIFAKAVGGNVTVNAGDVTSTGNTAVIGRQTNAAGAGIIDITVGNVSGTTGIEATNSGTGATNVTANGTVTGTLAEGIIATGNDAVTISVADTVTGATDGLTLVGGTGGAGNISVTGTGGFLGGAGDGANIKNNGSGTVTVDISGASGSTGGNGIIVRDTAVGGDISLTTGAVTALALGKNAIDVITQSTTANVTEVANGDIQAGNAGMVGAILNAAATGEVNVTANGSIDARFGIDAENFGSGNTLVTTVGPVNATSGNGIFALSTGGHVVVTAGDVTSTGNTAIIAQQTKVAGAGLVGVNAGNVSGTTGIDAHNFGTGDIGVNAIGTVTGTAAEGIKAVGNAGVFVTAGNTVTGATRGLSLIGGTGGTGDIWVAGIGGFVGGSDDAANILNNGAGTVTVDVSGASSSTGGNGFFIRDTAIGGNVSITTGAVTALAVGKNAIDVITQSTTANVTEVADGDIKAGNAGMVGAILNAAATGNVDVTANGAMTARFGVDAENFGTGNTKVTTVGPVNVTTGNGIFALTKGGNVTVTAGDVTSTGNTAIIAQQTNAAGAGNIDVTAGNVSGATGITAINSGTGTLGVTTNGTVTGTAGDGITATGNNAVTVNAADTVTGAVRGLTLTGGTGGAGNISVTGTGFFGGTGDAANVSNGGGGTTTVNISGASGSTGGNGIVVADTAAGGGISITTGAVTALTAGKNAIYAVSASLTGNVTEVANGNIQAGNAGLVAAILPAASTGNVNVTANGAITARFGVDAENFGTGTTSVTTVGPVNVTTGNGIFALTKGGNVTVNAGDATSTGNIAIIAQQTNAAGAGNINVTAGNVSGTNGVVALNSGTGTVGVTTNGIVTGTTGDGIKAIGNNAVTVAAAGAVTGGLRGLTVTGGTGGAGNISVTGTGGFFGGTGDGAHIQNNGSGTVTVNISGASGSTSGNGIAVDDTAAGGDISVTTGAVTALGAGSNGIDVFGVSNTGNVTVVANGAVRGGNAGIVAGLISTSTGNVAVTANGAVTGQFGVDAENYGTGNVTVTTIGPVTATTGYGVVGLTQGGNVTVTTGAVSSTGAAAILAEQINSAAAGTVGVTAGNVSGTRGIIAQTNGSGGVSVNALGNVTATNGNGIEAINFNPAANAGTLGVSQAAGTKITATNGAGIYTNSGLSTGMTTITVAGEITAGTPGFAGVYGTSTKGGITVNVTGTGKIDPDYGIDLSTVDGPLVVNNAGLVTGTIDGVRLVATGTGSANISNTGTITGGTNAVLISVNNTPSTLFNSGTINGAIKMLGTTVATSNWINGPTGIANLTGASSISGNLVNGGNVNLGAGGTLTVLGNTNNAGRVTFAGAGTFTTAGSMANTGIINARNNLTGNVVTVGGNYSGGGQFWADYSTNTATADRLNIGGSATGNTNVTMNLVGPRSFVPGGFLPVVTVAGAAPGNAFTSSTPFPTTGFILDSFGQNPSNAHQFGVIQAVNPTAAGLGNLSYMAESASGLLDDPISPFVTNRPDAGGTRFSLWMRGSGGHSTQTISSSLTGGGLSYGSTSRFRTSQHAAQIGADVSFGGIGGGWKVNVGVMGGWYGASAPLAGGERIKVETPFVGGYAVIGNGAFELEGNIRKEWRHYTVAMPSLFGTVGTQRMRGDATAGSARISYRIGTKIGFAATPFASFNYADTKIDPLALDAFSVWTPGSDTTKIGQAGLRLSYRGGSEATATVEPFISAARMENWSRGDSSSFAFGAPVTTFSLQSNTWKNAMRYSAGILANAHGSRVSGFVVGNIDDDSRLRSFTIHAGLRFNF